MDFGEVVGTVKDNVISDIFGESGLLHIKSLKHQYETITPTDKRSKEDLNSFIMKNIGADNMSKYYRYIHSSNNITNNDLGFWEKGIFTDQLNAIGAQSMPRTSMLSGLKGKYSEYDPTLLLTENELKTYDIMITDTPTEQNSNYMTENAIINGNMIFRGDGGIEYSFSQEAGSYRDWETDRKSTRLNSSHSAKSRMPSSA